MMRRPWLELIASILLLTTIITGLVVAVDGPVNIAFLIGGLLLGIAFPVLRYMQRRHGERADERIH